MSNNLFIVPQVINIIYIAVNIDNAITVKRLIMMVQLTCKIQS